MSWQVGEQAVTHQAPQELYRPRENTNTTHTHSVHRSLAPFGPASTNTV